MATVSTIYRGYEITYNENSENWYCSDLVGHFGDGSSYPKLSDVKAKIDKMIAAMRKKEAVNAYQIDSDDRKGPSLTASVITEYLGVEKGRYDKTEITKVASMAIRRDNDRPSRMEHNIRSLVPDTPAALEAFKVAEGAFEELKLAKGRYQAAVAAIPRITLDDIKGLVEIYQSQQTEE